MDGEDIIIGGCFVVLGGIVVTALGGGAHGINALVVDNKYNKATEELEGKRVHLSETLAQKIDVSNFDIASLELAKDDGDYLFKVFGSTSVEKVIGLKENKYVNVFFNISDNAARKVLNAIDGIDSAELNKSYDSPEHFATMGDYNGWRFSESGRIKRTLSACSELYNALEEAVWNSYAHRIEEITEASAMNNSISRDYRYARPDVVGDTTVTGWFTHGSTTFINAGVMTTSISQVVKDEERGVSYFLVDTLQGRESNGNMVLESCRARVEVEGTDLTQEEVYAKFIKGEHSSFTEIIREKLGEKVGVVNNQLQKDVDEIELL